MKQTICVKCKILFEHDPRKTFKYCPSCKEDKVQNRLRLCQITDNDLLFGLQYLDRTAELNKEAQERFGTTDTAKIQEIICGKVAIKNNISGFKGRYINYKQNAKFDYNDQGDCKVSKEKKRIMLYDKIFEKGIEEKVDQSNYYVIGFKNKYGKFRYLAYVNEISEDFKQYVKEQIKTKVLQQQNAKSRFHGLSIPLMKILDSNKTKLVSIDNEGNVKTIYEDPNIFIKDVEEWRRE